MSKIRTTVDLIHAAAPAVITEETAPGGAAAVLLKTTQMRLPANTATGQITHLQNAELSCTVFIAKAKIGPTEAITPPTAVRSQWDGNLKLAAPGAAALTVAAERLAVLVASAPPTR